MESITPPSHKSDPKPRPTGTTQYTGEESPNLPPLELIPSSSTTLSPNPSKLHDLLLLSPSPHRKSRTRLADRLEMGDQEAAEPKRRSKNRNAGVGSLNCGSPRNNNRRSRKRFEQEIREIGVLEEMPTRKRRNGGARSKKEKHKLGTSPGNDGGCHDLDRIGCMISDLIMWNDVAKSSLWFGFGSLGFLSSCFTSGVGFSILSVLCQLGLLFLGVSFFSNSICQRGNAESKREIKLTEDDIVKAARVVLPAANLAIRKTRELFSGDPSITLKVAPVLLLGAEYGHLITLWRLCVLAFFTSFTGPKLYSCYSVQVNEKVAYLRHKVFEAWGSCSHKKVVAASAATAFWNLTSFKTRVFAAFISMVLLRYHRQYSEAKEEERETEEGHQQGQQQQQQEQQLALVSVANGSEK